MRLSSEEVSPPMVSINNGAAPVEEDSHESRAGEGLRDDHKGKALALNDEDIQETLFPKKFLTKNYIINFKK